MKLSNLKEQSGRIFEAEKKDGKIKFPVIIISQGLGNLADRNYYSAEAIQFAADNKIYEGKKAYYDHPTQEEEETRPNRSVRETCGHYEDTRAEKDENGLLVLKGNFIPEPDSPIISKMLHAIEFKKKYPDKDYIGISINGDGEGEQMDYDSFLEEVNPSEIEMEKIAQCEGQPINVIKKLTAAFSADVVTEAGAKGRILLEQETKIKKGKKMKFIEQMKKLLSGIGSSNSKLVEEAVGEIMKQEEDEAKEKAKKEAVEACLAKVKQEMKKEEAESEEEYEAKCMAEAVKRHEAESKQAADAAKDEKQNGEKPEGDEAEEEKHDDEKQDVELIKKMMGEMEEMKKEIAALKGAKQEAEAEAKKHHEEAAKAKTILQEKERNEQIETVLAECGLPYRVTKELRPVLEKCKTVVEMKETAKRMKESFSKVVESAFINTTGNSFPEKSISEDNKNNDILF